MAVPEALAAIDWLLKIVAVAKSHRDKLDRKELRSLLANLYFSKESIERIARAAKANPSEIAIAPKEVLKQLWDTRIMVGEALEALDQRVDSDQFGLRGEKLIFEIKYAKQEIRKTLADICVDAVKDGKAADLANVLEKIGSLNKQIEQLDFEIGGIFAK